MSRILIIDDDPGNRLILQSRLTAAGHGVVAADGGALGLVEAHEHSYDLILVAAEMHKGIDGFEVCKRLKARRETASTPVIVCNQASGAHEAIDRAYQAGCDAYVTRVELPGLDHIVRMLLKTRQSAADLMEQNRGLQEQVRKLSEERPRSAEAEGRAVRENHEHANSAREVSFGRADGALIVDGEGIVRHADRGACEILGNRIVGRHLGSLAPASRLEAFVRDAHIEARDGFRFDVVGRKGSSTRSCVASVLPLVPEPGETETGLRVVLFSDVSKQRAHNGRAHESPPAAEERAALLEAARCEFRPGALVGCSACICELREEIVRAGHTTDPVLILGAPGTGKTRIARTLHYSGSNTGPFLHVRCGAQTPDNLELSLFGCAKGADSGSSEDRFGLMHQAQDGTLYLDGIAALSREIQNRLLRFLADHSVSRKGAHRAEHVDLRVIASSETPLDDRAGEGRFSPDLLARLSQFRLVVPPLAEHPDDLEPLARHFVQRYSPIAGEDSISDEALDAIKHYSWPGNVAELEGCIEQACVSAGGGPIALEHLPRAISASARTSEGELRPVRSAGASLVPGTHSVPGTMRDVEMPRSDPRPRVPRDWEIDEESPVSFDFYEQQLLKRALHRSGGDKLRAAKLLEVGKSTLYRKLKRYGIR